MQPRGRSLEGQTKEGRVRWVVLYLEMIALGLGTRDAYDCKGPLSGTYHERTMGRDELRNTTDEIRV